MRANEVQPKPYGVAHSLNPEAGDHAVATDEIELGAAVRAVERSYKEFPYYEARYSERGRSFGASDSAWLVTLCDRTLPAARDQVRWLGAVLASRGMPQVLLEEHLRFLHEELIAAAPDRRARYHVIAECARDLRERRQKRIDAESTTRIIDAFEEKVASCGFSVGRAAHLIVSAVADEAQGIKGAVSSLVSWLADPARFEPSWLQAVHRAIDAARAAVSPARKRN